MGARTPLDHGAAQTTAPIRAPRLPSPSGGKCESAAFAGEARAALGLAALGHEGLAVLDGLGGGDPRERGEGALGFAGPGPLRGANRSGEQLVRRLAARADGRAGAGECGLADGGARA